ncbi:hypothetical protein H8356DRAFT_1343607 [Neocallimastix lanati (nom. inval.)]|nr:hypothetical protein H8356DRAFT_1343607 [Neocallimastix sp. JGI-2020a]
MVENLGEASRKISKLVNRNLKNEISSIKDTKENIKFNHFQLSKSFSNSSNDNKDLYTENGKTYKIYYKRENSMEYPFNAYSLTDLLDELEFNKSTFDDTNTDNFNFQLYLNYIRYQSLELWIQPKKREKNYASSTEACIRDLYLVSGLKKYLFWISWNLLNALSLLFYSFVACYSYLGYSYIENYKLITNIAAYVNIMKDLISKNKKYVIKEETIRNGLLILILSCLIYFTLSISAEGYKEKRNRNSLKSFIEPINNKKKYFEVRNANFYYNNLHVNKSIDFNGYEGEIIGIIGHNRC